MSKNKDSVSQTLIVAFVLCIVCSVIVATAAVGLRSKQQANKLLDRNKNILAAAGLIQGASSKDEINRLFKKFEIGIINLETGQFLTEAELTNLGIDPATYDVRKAAKDPALSTKLAPSDDLAAIGRVPLYTTAYVLREAGSIKEVVLPVNGYGLWGTLYGFLALKGDGNTVVGLGFYEHKETPGLGAKVDEAEWKAQWPDKEIYDADRNIVIALKRDPSGAHEVDALSGATLTTRGVENLLHFWMGPLGYKKFLNNLEGGQL